MVKIKVIFGEDACNYYDEHPNQKKLKEYVKTHGGTLEEREFETEKEYKAYLMGLNDMNGWFEFWVIEKDGKPV